MEGTLWANVGRLRMGFRGTVELRGLGFAEGRNAPNVVVSSEPDPLRNRAVLLLGLGQLLLGSERLVALEGIFISVQFEQCQRNAVHADDNDAASLKRALRRHAWPSTGAGVL